MPDPWEDAITRCSRLDLERALGRLCAHSPALLWAAVDGERVRVPRVHLLAGEPEHNVVPGIGMVSGSVRCGARWWENRSPEGASLDPLAATCVECKRVAEGR